MTCLAGCRVANTRRIKESGSKIYWSTKKVSIATLDKVLEGPSSLVSMGGAAQRRDLQFILSSGVKSNPIDSTSLSIAQPHLRSDGKVCCNFAVLIRHRFCTTSPSPLEASSVPSCVLLRPIAGPSIFTSLCLLVRRSSQLSFATTAFLNVYELTQHH